MINRTAIQQWSEHAPWIDNAQIEQDLIICRALVDIFSDEFLASQLAFRGGTALHKLYLSPQSRYSEDIDLVQIAPGPIKPIMCRFLKHGAPKNFAFRGRLMPELVQVLRSIGEHNITHDVETRIGQLFTETPGTDTIEYDLLLAPVWMRQVIKKGIIN